MHKDKFMPVLLSSFDLILVTVVNLQLFFLCGILLLV